MSFKADLLKRKLKEEGQTLDKFSKAVGVSTRTVNRWKSGENTPKPKDLEKIARVLNCKPQDFDPFFADLGLGEVSIQAPVSTASHNAYELMRWRYGVSQKQIMELAPVLFAIVAGHALKVPDQDDELEHRAQMNGRPSTQMIGDNIDRQASKLGQCFGVASSDPNNEPSRNLFDTAIHRLSVHAAEYVDASWYIGAEPGVVPGASGYVPVTGFLEKITDGDGTLAEAIVKGRIRLSTILQKAKDAKGGVSVEEFARAIRHAHAQGIEEQRKAGLKKLTAWRAFYAKRHPDLAEEYDDLVTQYCHEEGWCPERYTDDDRVQSWVNPFGEDRFIDKNTLNDVPTMEDSIVGRDGSRRKKKTTNPFKLSPTESRFGELQRHRAQLKKQFEEAWS